ncbi:MAG: UvrD-helicase domain-containing protein [Synergistaceae bacterium]|nr:UvrD-helicase domain-containing protein [Synergistaceae bacterium]
MNENGKNILFQLSERQQEAVKYIDGPLFVLAGAGSGKTRVLTHKIAWLTAENITQPQNILAVTFTNKAAGEMRTRIDMLVPGEKASRISAGTFHSFGVKFLFRNMKAAKEIVNLRDGFTVFDRDDCKNLMKDIMTEANISKPTVMEVLDLISREYMSWSPIPHEPFFLNEQLLDLAKLYRKKLRELNAVDFDDLIILPLEILKNDMITQKYEQSKIQWLLVDEYQDVNKAQYLLIKYLAGKNCTINVVGDPDQSIYGWRGAEVELILNFTNDFPGAKTIILDENYRSTKNILEASNALIRNNRSRLKKNLHTAKSSGEKIYTLLAQTDFQEADFLVQEIDRLHRVYNYNYGNIAILYRQNAMSRLYERRFLEENIPYRIIRGLSFYERAEVKDVLAMLKLAVNPFDMISLERIANLSKYILAGIGPKTLGLWNEWLNEQPQELFDSSLNFWEFAAKGNWKVKGKAGESMKKFAEHICEILKLSETGIKVIIDYILHEMDYIGYVISQYPENSDERLANVRELKSIVPDGNLVDALAEAALFTDADTGDAEARDAVGLMTLHASKGLEFPVVFIVGLEEGIFPSPPRKDYEDYDKTIEEERRVFYVGMTRAEERLYLSAARSRRLYGEIKENELSRFLFEVPDECKRTDDRGKLYRERNSGGQNYFWRKNNYGGNSNHRRHWGG